MKNQKRTLWFDNERQHTEERTPSGSGFGYGNQGWGNGGWGNQGNSGKNESKSTDFQYDPYQESDQVKQAYETLQQKLAAKPGAYESPWQAQLNGIIDQIMNREKFNYDVNADALYQQYKDQYTTQGQMAMMDTMGMAAAMTGGYGNSYAQSVGQQVYQGYLQQLNDKVPELYQLALDKYQMEGDNLYNQYALLGTQEEQEYGRYRDTVADWNAALDRAQSQYNAERDYDYGKYTDNRNFDYGVFSDDRAYDYQVQRDKVLDAQWQAEFDLALRQYEDSIAGSSGGGGGSEEKKSSGTGGKSVEEVYLTNKQNGASATELDNYLKAAISEGRITQQEATELREQRY